MTTLIFMNAAVDNLLSTIEMELLVVTEMLKDTSFPLADRWEVYLKVEHLLPVGRFYSDSVNILTDNVYDDLHTERYQTKFNSDVDQQLLENYEDEAPEADADQWTKDYYARYQRMWTKRDEWREAVLAEGQGGFTYDW